MKSQLISLLVLISTGMFIISGCGSNLLEPEQPLAMKGITDELLLTGDVTAMHDSMLQYPTMPYIEGIAVGILTPIFGKPGSLVQIHGLNFGYSGDSIKVMFENINVEIVSVNPRTITVKAPDKLGSAKVIVTKGIYTAVSPQRFTITNESIFLTSMEFELKGVEFEIKKHIFTSYYPEWKPFDTTYVEKVIKDTVWSYNQNKFPIVQIGYYPIPDCNTIYLDFSFDTASIFNYYQHYVDYDIYMCHENRAFFVLDTINQIIRFASLVIDNEDHDRTSTTGSESLYFNYEFNFDNMPYNRIGNKYVVELNSNNITKYLSKTFYKVDYNYSSTGASKVYEEDLQSISFPAGASLKLILTRE